MHSINNPFLISVEDVKKKWKGLRDYRKKKLAKKVKPTGTERSVDDSDKEDDGESESVEDDALDFLDKCPLERSTISNVSYSEDPEVSNDVEMPSEVDSSSTLLESDLGTATGFTGGQPAAAERSSSPLPSTSGAGVSSVKRKKTTKRDFLAETIIKSREERNEKFEKIDQMLRGIDAPAPVHSIRKMFDCFADSVIELPPDLQRAVKTGVMALIAENEEIAAQRQRAIIQDAIIEIVEE